MDSESPSSSSSSSSSATDGALRLPDWGLITATGLDSASFLNGQLTQAIADLAAGEARLAGYCSAKGRLLATFWAWKTAPDTVALACSADLLAPTLKRLSMFVMRAKCKLSDASAATSLYGIAGVSLSRWWAQTGAEQPELPAPGHCVQRGEAWLVRLPDADGLPRALLVQPATADSPALPVLGADTWAWLEVRSGVARVTAATVEQFVPQMVNLELTGGVNFQKGCYPGQEIVARSQYRGTLKRRMYLVEADAPVRAGAEIVHSADPGQPAGMVVLAGPAPNSAGRWAALVELKTALATAAGELRTDDALLRLDQLPYALPAEAGT